MVRQSPQALGSGGGTMTVNDSAQGVWAKRVGEKLVYVRPGANHLHVIVKRKGERKCFGFPARWLDGGES